MSRKTVMPARQVQRLDTSHGLDGDEPAARPRQNGINAEACRSVDLSVKCVLRNHEAGSARRPVPKESMMRFYNQQHRYYCGVDLHARNLAAAERRSMVARGESSSPWKMDWTILTDASRRCGS